MKELVFKERLEYWKGKLEVAKTAPYEYEKERQERIKYCEKMVEKAEKMVANPQSYAGY